MSGVQNNGGTGGITGKGFMPGRSGNPGGRPKGLARATRELVGDVASQGALPVGEADHAPPLEQAQEAMDRSFDEDALKVVFVP
jgi:hypothetical protein